MTPALKDSAALQEAILDANREVHAREGALYLARHPEQTNRFIDRVRKQALDSLCAQLSGPRVLDLGCGTGYLYLELLARGLEMTGVDLSRDMLAALEKRIPPAAPSRLVEADVAAFLQRADDAYDGIVCSALLHHLYDYRAVLAQACRVLKPGGLLLIFFEPLKQEIASPLRYRLHRILAQMDEALYRWQMQRQGIAVFEEDYSLSDYQRRFGGIDPAAVCDALASEGVAVQEMQTCCARRHALFARIATSILHTHNTFHLLAKKNAVPHTGSQSGAPSQR